MKKLEDLEKLANAISKYRAAYNQAEYSKKFVELVTGKLLPLTDIMAKAGIEEISFSYRFLEIKLRPVDCEQGIFFDATRSKPGFKSCTTVVAANGFSDWDFNEAMSKENGRNICEEIEETVVNHFTIIENMVTEAIYDKLSRICIDLNIS